MPESVNWDSNHKIAIIISKETTDISIMLGSLKKALLIVEEHKGLGIMVDARELLEMPSVDSIFQFLSNIPDESSLAIVQGYANEDKLEFFTEIARTKGKDVRNFIHIDTAIKWLTNRPSFQ